MSLIRLPLKQTDPPRSPQEMPTMYDLPSKDPEWFAVVGVSRLYQGQDLRLSYVSWQEEVRPIVIIELLSPGTQDEDLRRREPQGKQPTKWKVYEQILECPTTLRSIATTTMSCRLFS